MKTLLLGNKRVRRSGLASCDGDHTIDGSTKRKPRPACRRPGFSLMSGALFRRAIVARRRLAIGKEKAPPPSGRLGPGL